MGREARHQEGEGRGTTGETRELDRRVGEAKEGQEGTQQGTVMDRGTEEQGPDCRDREPRPNVRSVTGAQTHGASGGV